MKHLILAAVALALPTVPALAQAAASATPGALAGRSPHQVFRPAVATPACGRSMHSLPAGKLPTYGTHALPAASCEDRQIAKASIGREARAQN